MAKKLFYTLFFVLCSLFFVPHAFAQVYKPPVLSVASPTEGQTIVSDKLTVSFIVGNFTFVDFHQKKTKGRNEGHVRMWLDQQQTDENVNEILSHDDVVFNNLPEGKHTLIVQVVNNDNSPFKPDIATTISFSSYLPIPLPPTPTPTPKLADTINQLSLQKLLILDGVVFLVIGFVLFLLFGRKKFFNK